MLYYDPLYGPPGLLGSRQIELLLNETGPMLISAKLGTVTKYVLGKQWFSLDSQGCRGGGVQFNARTLSSNRLNVRFLKSVNIVLRAGVGASR